MEDVVWISLSEGYGVLELQERLTAPCPAMDLHVVFGAEADETIAWWSTECGALLRVVSVGSA